MEKEVTGLYVSGHPLAQYRQVAQQLHTVELEELQSDSDEPIHMSAGKYQDGDIVKVLCIVTKKKDPLAQTAWLYGVCDTGGHQRLDGDDGFSADL